jgi:short-subunit dehydrogenase
MRLDGRTALVTGASAGLGRVIARALHARGVTLIVSARREELLTDLCSELGERAEAAAADLSDPVQVAALAERARSVDVLVANAGVPATGPYDGFSPEDIDLALDVNLRAPIQLTRALAPAMVERGEGHLVYVSSLLGKMTRAGSALYSAGKYGVRGFALGLREDLHGTGVGVTTVFPGFVRDTGMFHDSGAKPPPGIGTSAPDEVAAAVIRGIEEDVAEIDVAPRKLRVAVKVMSVAPGLGAKMQRRSGR